MPDAEDFFVDTNVLLYSVDSSHPQKRDQARLWLDHFWTGGTGRLSWQVLQEFCANAERKLRMPRAQARAMVEVFAQWRPVEMSLGLLQRGWYWMDHAQLPFRDSLIIAAAEKAGCAWLLSENSQAGQKFGSVTVVNPFLETPGEFRSRRPAARRT